LKALIVERWLVRIKKKASGWSALLYISDRKDVAYIWPLSSAVSIGIGDTIIIVFWSQAWTSDCSIFVAVISATRNRTREINHVMPFVFNNLFLISLIISFYFFIRLHIALYSPYYFSYISIYRCHYLCNYARKVIIFKIENTVSFLHLYQNGPLL